MLPNAAMRNPETKILIGRGESAEVYRLSGGQILKLFDEKVLPGVMQREYDGAALAWSHGLRVARPLGWRTEDVRTGLLFEDLTGGPLFGAHLWGFAAIRAALRQLAHYQADLHRHGAGGLIHRQSDILRSRIASSTAPEAIKAVATEVMARLPDGDRLCHGDLHPGNALLTDEGVAVIDWANACAGNPAADVARTALLIGYGRYGQLGLRYRLLRVLRHLAASYYKRCYRAASAMTAQDIEAWTLPVGVAWLQGQQTMDEPALLTRLIALARQHRG